MLYSKDFIKIDTIPIATVKWNPKTLETTINLKESELRAWLQKEMKLDTLFIKRERQFQNKLVAKNFCYFNILMK